MAKAAPSAAFNVAQSAQASVPSPSLVRQPSDVTPFSITSVKRRRDEEDDYDV